MVKITTHTGGNFEFVHDGKHLGHTESSLEFVNALHEYEQKSMSNESSGTGFEINLSWVDWLLLTSFIIIFLIIIVWAFFFSH